MGLSTEADDWQVLCINSFGVALGLAAAVFIFDFNSETAGLTARFRFVGFGSGIGTRILSVVLPGLSDWSQISCDRPFSVVQLDHTSGTMASASVGVGATIGPCLISAIKSSGSLFSDQDAGGLSAGLSAGAFLLAGRWRFNKIVLNSPSAPTGA
jgi:hypothetical protein